MEEKKERKAVAKKIIEPMMKEWEPISPKMPVPEPEEVAEAVRFCVKNAFVNGSVIEITGGYCYK